MACLQWWLCWPFVSIVITVHNTTFWHVHNQLLCMCDMLFTQQEAFRTVIRSSKASGVCSVYVYLWYKTVSVHLVSYRAWRAGRLLVVCRSRSPQSKCSYPGHFLLRHLWSKRWRLPAHPGAPADSYRTVMWVNYLKIVIVICIRLWFCHLNMAL